MQAWFFEVVVAARGATGAGFQAQLEAFDHRFVGDHAAVLHVGGGSPQLGEHRLVVAEHQQVAIRAMAEVVVDTFLLAQALDKVQVGLVVLHAIVARGVAGTELEQVAVAGEDAVLLQYPGDDLRHRELLEDTLVVPMGEVRQARHQTQAIAGQALA
ncbi:hypothetical protein D3C84_890920 [compost metagenome]